MSELYSVRDNQLPALPHPKSSAQAGLEHRDQRRILLQQPLQPLGVPEQLRRCLRVGQDRILGDVVLASLAAL